MGVFLIPLKKLNQIKFHHQLYFVSRHLARNIDPEPGFQHGGEPEGFQHGEEPESGHEMCSLLPDSGSGGPNLLILRHLEKNVSPEPEFQSPKVS